MNVGVVICSRLNSRRIERKPFQDIAGKRMLDRLVERLTKANLKVILAVPDNEREEYEYFRSEYGTGLFIGSNNDPLKRMYDAADMYNLDTIIRVCHDKIFVEPELVFKGLEQFERKILDYLYSDEFTDGTAFEIISMQALEAATTAYSGVEHVSYAIKSITKNYDKLLVPDDYKTDLRLLVDYPNDLKLMRYLFDKLGDPSLEDVIAFYEENQWIKDMNKLPLLTIYTCAKDASLWIDECINSVTSQAFYSHCEYILIDDGSSDDTYDKMLEWSTQHDNIKVFKNAQNIGLSSSCNVALRHSRSKYIMRIDADDYFIHSNCIDIMLREIIGSGKDVIYPNNYHGSEELIQKGSESHHIGGAIFKTRAVNHIKFTDKLMNYEGLDFFEKAKFQLNIGYINKPIFFYRQSDQSMSKTNLVERSKIYKTIMNRPQREENTQETIAP